MIGLLKKMSCERGCIMYTNIVFVGGCKITDHYKKVRQFNLQFTHNIVFMDI